MNMSQIKDNLPMLAGGALGFIYAQKNGKDLTNSLAYAILFGIIALYAWGFLGKLFKGSDTQVLYEQPDGTYLDGSGNVVNLG